MISQPVAALRITRTKIGIAIFTKTKLEFARCINVKHTATSLRSLVNWSMEHFKDLTIAIEKLDERTTSLFAELLYLAKERGLPVIVVATQDLLNAYSFPPLTSRNQLRKIASTIWPGLVLMNKGEVLDAAALALYVQTERILATTADN